jgi:hypothetical protein
MPRQFHPPWFNRLDNIFRRKLLTEQFSSISCHVLCLIPKHLSQHSVPQTLNLCSSINRDTKLHAIQYNIRYPFRFRNEMGRQLLEHCTKFYRNVIFS